MLSLRAFLVLFFLASVLEGCSAASKGNEAPPPCGSDESELNDDGRSASTYPEMADNPDSTQKRELTLHSETDVDFVDVKVNDTGLGGNPTIAVSVSPSGFEVATRFTCANAKTQCVVGKSVEDPDLGTACTSDSTGVRITTECDGSTDSGSLRIRVRRVAPRTTCDRYTLTISVT